MHSEYELNSIQGLYPSLGQAPIPIQWRKQDQIRIHLPLEAGHVYLNMELVIQLKALTIQRSSDRSFVPRAILGFDFRQCIITIIPWRVLRV